jgi:hypothetical protein
MGSALFAVGRNKRVECVAISQFFLQKFLQAFGTILLKHERKRVTNHRWRKTSFGRKRRFCFASFIGVWIEKACDYSVDTCEDFSERATSKMSLSGREELVDEVTEVCRGNGRHKGTLKRNVGKRKSGVRREITLKDRAAEASFPRKHVLSLSKGGNPGSVTTGQC